MPPLHRLAVLLLALGAPLLASASANAAGSSCTTAALRLDRPASDVLFDSIGCATTKLQVTPNPVARGAQATFDTSGSVGVDGTAGDIASYLWDFGEGTPVQTASSSTTHAYATRGHYPAVVGTLDGADDPIAQSDAVDVVVSGIPVAALSAPAGRLKPMVLYDFDASGSSVPDALDGASIAHYDWDWGDGTTSQTTTPITQHAFADDGVSTAVSVTVVNDLGVESPPASAAVLVDNLVPLVQLLATPPTVATGQQLTLSAAGSVDPDGTIAGYRWDLDGDGTTYERSTGTTPTVTAGGYPNAGRIVIGVKVIDDSGDWTVKSVPITVTGSDGGGKGSSGSAGGGGGGGSQGTGNGASGSSAFVLGLDGTPIQKLAHALKRGIGLSASANRKARGTVTLTVTARDAKKLHLRGRGRGRKPVTVGTLKLSLSPGRTVKPSVKLTRNAARAFRSAHPRSLRITIIGVVRAGAARTSAARIVLLRG